MSQSPTTTLDKKTSTLDIDIISPVNGCSSARSRHRERKINSRISLSSRPPFQQIESSPTSPSKQEDKPEKRNILISGCGGFLEKSKVIGSLEDVVGEEPYRITDYLNNEKTILSNLKYNSAFAKGTAPNLGEIKARNPILVKNELQSVRTHLLQKNYELQKKDASTPVDLYRINTFVEKRDSPVDEFRMILKQNDFSILKLLNRLPVSAIKHDTVSQLQVVFQDHEYLDCILSLMKKVVLNTNQASMLFRENKLSNRLIDSFINKEADQYLKTVLKQPMKSILVSRDPFEIDPKYLSDEESLPENIIHLVEMTNEIISSLFDSSTQIPRNVQFFFYSMRKQAQAKFLNDPDIALKAISAFIILRFFNPALIKASLENMEDIERNTRKFVLISKIIQKLANFQLFEKEKHMVCLNNFLDINIPKMKKFLHEISLPCDPLYNFYSFSPEISSCFELAEAISSLLGALYTFEVDTQLLDNLDNVIKELRNQAAPITENRKSLTKYRNGEYGSQAISIAGSVSLEMQVDMGKVQIVENDRETIESGQVPSISNASIPSPPNTSKKASLKAQSNSLSNIQGNCSNLREEIISLPPPVLAIQDKAFNVISQEKIVAEQSDVKIQIEDNVNMQLVPVEQTGWRKRRSFWANVLIIVFIIIILGIGVGISYWKLYMG